MKGKPRLWENIFLVLLVFVDIFLLGMHISNNGYKIGKKASSTANYVSADQLIENNPMYEFSIINKLEKQLEEKQIEEKESKVEQIVYDGMTLNELADKLNRSLNSTISGKGYLIASRSLEKGVDPYMATAIMLHETGCKWNCSYLVNSCNNVGGQKGTGCGAYSYFNSLDEGITAFIDNLHNNYINYGLTTPEEINPKYAEDPNWSYKVNKYIEEIKAQ